MSSSEIRGLKNALIGCEGNTNMMNKATEAARAFLRKQRYDLINPSLIE
jgi:hypothetical protein